MDPVGLVDRYGTDAVRWWLLREVPRVGETDFTEARLVDRANEDLAAGAGNLVNRVVTMVHRYRAGRLRPIDIGTVATAGAGARLAATCRQTADAVDLALAGLDFRRATAAVWSIVEQANRYLAEAQPWQLATAEAGGAAAAGIRLDGVLAIGVAACLDLAAQLGPFLPQTAARIAAQCTARSGRLPVPDPVFPRLEPAVPVDAVSR